MELGFSFLQSCWVDKCFMHEAQGRKGCQRFKNILRNSLNVSKLSGGVKKEAVVLHQLAGRINPCEDEEWCLWSWEAILFFSLCVLYIFCIDLYSRSKLKEVEVPLWSEGSSVSLKEPVYPIWRIVTGLEVLPAHGSSFRVFPLDWQPRSQGNGFKWQQIALA